MDGRESMAISGSGSYYLHRGIHGSGSGSGTLTHPGLNIPSGFIPVSNTNISVHSNVRDSSLGSAFPVEDASPHFGHGLNMGMASGVPTAEPVKKKRGRPRKYGPDGSTMSLGHSPLSSKSSAEPITPTPKKARGRPPGSGRKQQLAPFGEWMNSSAGLAFAPHIMHIEAGEDIASKILSFSQQRSRAVCILTATGMVSAVSLRQPASSANNVTYEGHFQILCLSGSYLIAESGGPRDRTGGLSVSLCSSDGHVIGGAVGGMLIAAAPVQVVVCSFVYGGSKTKDKTAICPKGEQKSAPMSGEIPPSPSIAPASQNLTPSPSTAMWPGSRHSMRNPQMEIDLTRG